MFMKNKALVNKMWEELKSPKKGNFSASQFGSNLWVIKDSKKRFGLLITGVLEEFKDTYLHIDIKKENKFRSNKTTLNNCIIFQNKTTITAKSFCDAISTQLDQEKPKDFYGVKEISKILKEVEKITKKTNMQLNEVVGVWGELLIIKEIIKNTTAKKDKEELIKAWESCEGRTIVDFNFEKRKTMIEVKTTTNEARIHHISSIKQITHSDDWKGYLASICVSINNNSGNTCSDLIDEIKKLLEPKIFKMFIDRTKVRGELLCRNNEYRFLINPNKKLAFYEFSKVPKPSWKENVIHVSWDIILEKINCITESKKNKLLEILN
jgi:hypothetical protein